MEENTIGNIPDIMEGLNRQLSRLMGEINQVSHIADIVTGFRPEQSGPIVEDSPPPGNLVDQLFDLLKRLEVQNSRLESERSRLEYALTASQVAAASTSAIPFRERTEPGL